MVLTSIDLAQEFNIKWDPISHRIRCLGHIINLAAHSFLFGTKDEELEGDEEHTRVKLSVQQMKEWRSKGPLGKLHNLNKWIYGSDIRLAQFLAFSQGRRIPRDNSTRWNSWEKEIGTSITPDMREALDLYLKSYGDEDILLNRLTDDDWNTLSKMYVMLAVLKQTTKSLEGSVIGLTKGLPAMDFILGHFEAGRKTYGNDTIMAPLYQNGWEKLKKYYNLTTESPAYVAAIVLNPCHKWSYIEEKWEASWVPQARVY